MLRDLLCALMREIELDGTIEVEYDFLLMSHPTAPAVALWLIRNPTLYANPNRNLTSVQALVDYLRTQGE